MKEKEIRADIIESTTSFYGVDSLLKIYKKALTLNKLINKDTGKAEISCYKRASNIIQHEAKDGKKVFAGQPESFLFTKDEEKEVSTCCIFPKKPSSTYFSALAISGFQLKPYGVNNSTFFSLTKS